MQCDAYDGYDRLTEVDRLQGPWTLVHCWSHLRRRFVKLARNNKSPIAEAAVRHIAQLYAIEAMVRGSSSPDIRLVARKEHSLPMVARSTPACRRARVGQGQAVRWPQTRSLDRPERGGCEIGGRDGRMPRGAAERKNGRGSLNPHRGAVKKNRLS
ncbi:hypothetical protein ABH999_000732 [Bradyrhizobium yuanmingense]